MGRRPIAPGVLKGYLLEEIVAYLIKNAGYRLITDVQTDPHDLALMGNGLQVRGRGGYHQADVLGELSWAPAFGNPIRLFIEAKWKGNGRGKVGIPETRHAVGILQDVNQVLVTVGVRPANIGQAVDEDDIIASGRSFCYTYRYALCSTSGFSAGAQAYALAHQIALLDLSHQDYDFLRETVDRVGDILQEYIARYLTNRSSIVKIIRATLRNALWGPNSLAIDEYIFRELTPLVRATRNIGELFVGVSATGFVILLKAEDPELMVRHMSASVDPRTRIYYYPREDESFRWEIIVESDDVEPCKLSFALPDALLRAMDEHSEGRRAAALNVKEQHFARITVYRITDTRSLICSLKLDVESIAAARRRVESRPRRPYSE